MHIYSMHTEVNTDVLKMVSPIAHCPKTKSDPVFRQSYTERTLDSLGIMAMERESLVLSCEKGSVRTNPCIWRFGSHQILVKTLDKIFIYILSCMVKYTCF